MQQIWAEIYENLYKKGESWYLSDDEIELLNEHNEEFTVTDDLSEKILEELDWEVDENKWDWLTVTHTLERVNIKNINKGVSARVSRTIFKRNGGKRKKSNGIVKYLIPPIKVKYDKIDYN
jgi:predicted P-loop ATPase